METVKQILAKRGYNSIDEMELGESVTVECDGFMDLIISRLSQLEVSVEHTYKQNGDPMSDPEIIFDVSDGEWTAIGYTSDPAIHRRDEGGLPDTQRFSKIWDENLKRQGFLDAATVEPAH